MSWVVVIETFPWNQLVPLEQETCLVVSLRRNEDQQSRSEPKHTCVRIQPSLTNVAALHIITTPRALLIGAEFMFLLVIGRANKNWGFIARNLTQIQPILVVQCRRAHQVRCKEQCSGDQPSAQHRLDGSGTLRRQLQRNSPCYARFVRMLFL